MRRGAPGQIIARVEPPETFLAAVPSLPVSDERRALAFWTDVVGLEALRGPDGADLGIVCREGVEVHVWLADGSAPGAETHLAGSASCRIRVSSVTALYERCDAAGVVHPRARLRDTDWGTREFSALDPDGNLVSFYATT